METSNIRKKVYYRKLVRDNTPKLIEESGRRAKFTYLIKEDRREYLIRKLNEEVDELTAADKRENLLEEAADVYEVLLALLNEAGYIDADLDQKARQKRQHCGPYTRFVWLESVEDV